MEYAIEMGLEDVISWVNDGRAVMIHDPKKLMDGILPYYFSHTKIRSLERQFNMWHFERVVYGPYKGAWTHPYFRRDQKSLCSRMSRHLSDNPWKHQPQSHWRTLTIPTTRKSALTARRSPPCRSQSSIELARKSSSLKASPTANAPYNLTLDSTSHWQDQKSLSDTEVEVVKPFLSYSIHNAHVNDDGDFATFAGRKFHFVDNNVNRATQAELLSPSQILSTATSLTSASRQRLPRVVDSGINTVQTAVGTPIFGLEGLASHPSTNSSTSNFNIPDTMLQPNMPIVDTRTTSSTETELYRLSLRSLSNDARGNTNESNNGARDNNFTRRPY